ncbi:MAG: VWA domain-containing protein [Frisingicoccus sp.]|uniref:vWA domain-containing protein n=1 Tax=Frisingicoccus sp. TaxID=1918627 RepID=UPI00261F86E7|nr:vWA domain-containing protein [Frisingicoccus sp.]MDD6231713.1 VWA domain-containing protein [Frisingicoccus sp.]
MKKFFAVIMIAMMLMCFMPSAAFGAASQEWQVSKSKEATNLDDNYESQVTLSLPSASYKPSVDVVMVIDVSSSMKENDISEAKTAALAMCDELASYTNVETKIGIVTFDREAHNLTDGMVSISDAKMAVDSIKASSDTNMMAGLIAGKAMLDAGSATEKYLVLMSDGIPIYWVNEKGEPTCKVLERYKQDGETLIETTIAPSEPEGSRNDVSAIIPVDTLLAASDWGTDSDIWAQISDTGATIENGYKYTNIQKCTYMTAEYLKNNIFGKYNLKMVAFGTDKYENNEIYKNGENFCDWIGAQEGVSYYKVAKPGYGGQDGDLTKAFAEITNELVQLVDTGSFVIDEIGKTDEYDFDFINDLSKLKLTVGGVSLEKEKISDNVYGFGPQTDGNENRTYRYTLTYHAQSEQTDTASANGEYFRWDINEAITINNTVQLTYTVKLVNPKTEAGTYGQYDRDGSKGYEGLYTNNKAILYPVDTTGRQGAAEVFSKPTVSYTVKNPYIPPVTHYYTVTYNDGVEGEVVFNDQINRGLSYYTLTPSFNGTPLREGYEFKGWTPAVAERVTADAYYQAVWEKSEEPVQPTEPTEPTEPTKPDKPQKPEKPTKPDKPVTEVPKTGDMSFEILFVSVFVLAMSAAAGVMLFLRKGVLKKK